MKLVQYSIAFAAVLIGGVAMATETSMSDSVTAKGSLRISDAAETVRRQRCCRRPSAPVYLFHLILTCLVCCVCAPLVAIFQNNNYSRKIHVYY